MLTSHEDDFQRSRIEPTDLLTKKEAAAYLHMSVSWVNQTLNKLCPVRKIGGRVKYLKDDLDPTRLSGVCCDRLEDGYIDAVR